LENLKEREILEAIGADGREDNIQVHLREILGHALDSSGAG
jgi:hypothetical protein